MRSLRTYRGKVCNSVQSAEVKGDGETPTFNLKHDLGSVSPNDGLITEKERRAVSCFDKDKL